MTGILRLDVSSTISKMHVSVGRTQPSQEVLELRLKGLGPVGVLPRVHGGVGVWELLCAGMAAVPAAVPAAPNRGLDLRVQAGDVPSAAALWRGQRCFQG